MFDIIRFYEGSLHRTDLFDRYWDNFPKGRKLRFKEQTLALLKQNVANQYEKGFASVLAILFYDGADSEYTEILLDVFDAEWHTLEEDIVEILGIIKDPRSVEKLYEIALDVPEYDEMRALSKKCIWALAEINTPESKEKLYLLGDSDDEIIKENADFQLRNISER